MKTNLLNCKVIMLPTDKEGCPYPNLITSPHGTLAQCSSCAEYRRLVRDCDSQPQHLYFVSDREIKDNDWCYDEFNDKIYQANEVVQNNKKQLKYPIFKIEATTDELYIASEEEGCDAVAGIPQSFIEAYVKSNGTIKEVGILLTERTILDETLTKSIIVATNNSNEVIVHLPEVKTYTRDEVKQLIKNAVIDCDLYNLQEQYTGDYKNLNQWLEENL